ncbi:hypothetical protein CDD81_5722 [Ophiocordyceps australis]|uniref:Uncharacterized protein n=1 Tax=Ophiocordyceps australis TaxID=1399860 RepID=A0A2C5Y213_9HYPO|nr:hypothetical protein CDD81_5722 [Ophiocordyceps australis]
MPSTKPRHGASGSGNRSILTFFKRLPSSPGQPQALLPSCPAVTPVKTLTPSSATSPPLSSPSNSLLPSSPTPIQSPSPTKESALFQQRSEIAASDDDDDSSSQGSLEDLSTLLGRARPAPSASDTRSTPGLPATPRAKRTAVEFHASPLTIMTKPREYKHKHKFDLKALAKDARRDDATRASCKRAKAATGNCQRNTTTDSRLSGDVFADIVKQKSGNGAYKVLRAVKRSEHQDQLRYCFFESEYSTPSSLPAPQEVHGHFLSLITHGSVKEREHNMSSGVPQTILHKQGDLPDTLFRWMLEDLCVQRSSPLRQGYCSMIGECSDQIHRILTPEYLQHLFARLGAHRDVRAPGSKLELCKMTQEPYLERDWSCLLSLLQLLGSIANRLSVSAAKAAAQTMLRMALDKFLISTVEVLAAFQTSIQRIANAISYASWDAFCYETCLQMSSAVESQTLRVDALLCLPVRSPRLHDLRRRFAIAFLFKDATLASRIPEKTVTIGSIIRLLDGNEFVINSQTNFTELKSSIKLLDMALDDGYSENFESQSDEVQFNKTIDELAAMLGDIWRNINDSGMKLARTEAKSVVECVQQRLVNSVRTRRKLKKSIFDVSGQDEDPLVIQKQQETIHMFLQKQSKPAHDCLVLTTE